MDNFEKITVAIAEDELPIRQLLNSYLENILDVELIGTVSTGNELLKLINDTYVTAVFLDIEMPDIDGLTVASKVKKVSPNTFIIFVTAHTKYAAESYNLDAIDYLVKPITEDSVIRSINKIKRYLNLDQKKFINNPQKILINNNHEIYFLNIDDIIFVEKELKKTIIHTKNSLYTTTMTLHTLENLLGTRFFRCHKGFIINTDKIEKIVPIGDRIYEIYFYNYKPKVTMRRQKYEEILEIITKRN